MKTNNTTQHLEIRYLKSFVVAARLLNFSEAASEMCVTQSTFSQTIKQLENELGCALFFRNSHEVTLTEAGRELLPYAEKTIRLADDCVNRMNDLRNLKCGTLDIGVTHSFNMVMHDTLKEFMHRYPGIRLNIVYKPMEQLIDQLNDRKLDFVLSFRPKHSYHQIESRMLFEDTLSVIMTKSHPLSRHESVTMDELKDYPVALPAKGLQARNVLEDVMAATGIGLDVRIEMNEVTPLLRLVRNTGLCTVLSSSATEDVDDLVAIPINHRDCRMVGSVHVLKGSYVKTAMREFIHILCDTSLVRKRVSEWIEP